VNAIILIIAGCCFTPMSISFQSTSMTSFSIKIGDEVSDIVVLDRVDSVHSMLINNVAMFYLLFAVLMVAGHWW
jgi:hypothetical protein